MSKAVKGKQKSIKDQCGDIVNTLKKIREDKEITTAMLESMTGILQPNITRMETGKTFSPSLQTILKIAEALDVEIKIVAK